MLVLMLLVFKSFTLIAEDRVENIDGRNSCYIYAFRLFLDNVPLASL